MKVRCSSGANRDLAKPRPSLTSPTSPYHTIVRVLGGPLNYNIEQVREVQEAGSVRTHFFNPWNIVEVITLATLAVAFFFRTWAFVCDGHGMLLCGELSTGAASVSDLNEVYLAQYFQAASAPFVLGKVLFLTQVTNEVVFFVGLFTILAG